MIPFRLEYAIEAINSQNINLSQRKVKKNELSQTNLLKNDDRRDVRPALLFKGRKFHWRWLMDWITG